MKKVLSIALVAVIILVVPHESMASTGVATSGPRFWDIFWQVCSALNGG